MCALRIVPRYLLVFLRRADGVVLAPALLLQIVRRTLGEVERFAHVSADLVRLGRLLVAKRNAGLVRVACANGRLGVVTGELVVGVRDIVAVLLHWSGEIM